MQMFLLKASLYNVNNYAEKLVSSVKKGLALNILTALKSNSKLTHKFLKQVYNNHCTVMPFSLSTDLEEVSVCAVYAHSVFPHLQYPSPRKKNLCCS